MWFAVRDRALDHWSDSSDGKFGKLARGRMWLAQGVLTLLLAGFALAAHADETDSRSLVTSFNSSGQDLLKQFVATPGNVVFSPYSIGVAMAMVLSGAKDGTATEMTSVLHQRLSHDRMDAANADVMAVLRRYTKPQAVPRVRGSAGLGIANAVMLTKDAVVSDAYVKRLEQDYAAKVFRNAGLVEINRWANHMTGGKIDHILDRPISEGIVLISAVYLRQAWRSPFVVRETTSEGFHLLPNKAIKVATMHKRGYFPVVARPGFRAIRLPYDTRSISMVIILPDTVDGATALAQRFDANELAELFVSLGGSEVYTDLSLPRFRTSFAAELKSKYQQAGLVRPFDKDRADFSGITGRPKEQEKLWIDNILHRTALEVTEKGTEAAAATATSLAEVTFARRPQPFTVDRPFLFYVIDDNTGLILFAGRISDPSRTN